MMLAVSRWGGAGLSVLKGEEEVMGRSLTWILGVSLLALAVGRADASIVAYDGFNYTVGAGLSGDNGGVGWGAAWGAIPSVTVQNPTPPLAVNPAVRLTQPNNDNAAHRMLLSAFAGSEVFVSFDFRFSAGAITSNDFMGLWVDNNSTTNHSTVPNIGLKAELGPGSSDYFVRVSGTDGDWSQAVQAQLGSTVQIVGRLWKTGSGPTAKFDRYSLWVNPDFADLGTPDVVANEAGSLTQFNTVGVRTANLGITDILYVDELRLGTLWGDVVASPEPVVIPEPATIIIWSLLGAGSWLGMRVWRRRGPVGRQPWSPANRQAIHEIIARGANH
jgi:hypothetical protein